MYTVHRISVGIGNYQIVLGIETIERYKTLPSPLKPFKI